MLKINVYDPSLDPKEFELPVDSNNSESDRIKILLRPIPKGKYSSLLGNIISLDKSKEELKALAERIEAPKDAESVLEKSNQLYKLKKAAEELAIKEFDAIKLMIQWGIAGHSSIEDTAGNEIKSKTVKNKWLNKEYDVLSEETFNVYASVPGLVESLFLYVLKFNSNESLL